MGEDQTQKPLLRGSAEAIAAEEAKAVRAAEEAHAARAAEEVQAARYAEEASVARAAAEARPRCGSAGVWRATESQESRGVGLLW